MDLNNLILFFFLGIFGLFFYKYFSLFLNKLNLNLFVDNEFKKPQAFHEISVSTYGGVGIFISLLILCLYLFLSEQIIYYEYLSFCTLFFVLGLMDDLKLNLVPKLRLILMIVFLIILIIFNNFYIKSTGIEFLNRFLEIDIFALFFISLWFLFVINGSNLIDGYNGLLSIHALVILINLFFVNYFGGNNDLALLIFSMILIIAVFLKFNFPRAKLFLGDSGSYLIGTFIAISVIKTSIENPLVSPFYFCILLFYLFFEVFFSFIRKIVREKRSPLFPDSKHLHMLLYKYLFKKNKNKFKSNYSVSLILNSIYLIMIVPPIFMMKSGMFCKYYSILLFVTYLFSYKKISEKIK